MDSQFDSHGEYTEEFLQESKQDMIYIISAVFMILGSLAVALRFVSKRVGRMKFGWDDGLIILAYLLCMAIASCVIADVKYGGVGLHEARVIMIDPKMIETWGKFIIILPLLYTCAVAPPKLAVLYLYLSIFTQKAFRITCYAVAFVIIGTWIGTFVSGCLSCRPLSFFWTQVGECFDINGFFRWAGFPNILTDLVMLVLPMPYIWRLHASVRLKIGIMFSLALGSVGLVSSVVRFYAFYVTDAAEDRTWAAVDLVIWTMAESSTYLIAACLPLYRPLIRRVWRKLGFATTNGSTDHQSGGSGMLGTSEHRDHNKFKRMTSSLDDDSDAVGLVRLGNGPPPHMPKGQIMVDRRFSVHEAD